MAGANLRRAQHLQPHECRRERRRKQHRHTRETVVATRGRCGPDQSRDGKPKNASPPKGTRPGHVARSAVAERRPKERTAHDPRWATARIDAATCRDTTERPDRNAWRRSARSRRATAPHNAQDRKGQRTSTLRGWRTSQSKGVRGRRRQRGPTNDRSGIAGGRHGSLPASAT